MNITYHTIFLKNTKRKNHLAHFSNSNRFRAHLPWNHPLPQTIKERWAYRYRLHLWKFANEIRKKSEMFSLSFLINWSKQSPGSMKLLKTKKKIHSTGFRLNEEGTCYIEKVPKYYCYWNAVFGKQSDFFQFQPGVCANR